MCQCGANYTKNAEVRQLLGKTIQSSQGFSILLEVKFAKNSKLNDSKLTLLSRQ